MSVESPNSTLVAHADGMFGRLEIHDLDGVRTLWCGGLCQGASRLNPPTADDQRPGSIPDAPYHLAWLLPAARHQRSRMLMAGLGCGAGAVALADNLPHAHITVVEIDPTVVSLALAHFPALAAAVRRGQIDIVRQDITEHAWLHRGEPWTLGLLDAFKVGPHSHYPPELLNALHGRCNELWINVLEINDELLSAANSCAELLDDCGWSARTLMPVRDYDGAFTGNVIVGTANLPDHPLAELALFPDCHHLAADRAREILTRLERLHRPWCRHVPRDEH